MEKIGIHRKRKASYKVEKFNVILNGSNLEVCIMLKNNSFF